MLNYFRFREFKDDYLITNDLGRYAFITKNELKDLVDGKIDPESPTGKRLMDGMFLFEGSAPAFIQKCTHLMRDSKNYVFRPTGLHIFVVTNACNVNCVYCQANNGITKSADLMTREIAERSVDIALSSPANDLSFEFQGGEPLINFDVIKHIVEYAEKNKGEKGISYSLVSNLTLLTDEMIEFF